VSREKFVRVQIVVTPELKDQLDKLSNKSAFIRAAIAEKLGIDAHTFEIDTEDTRLVDHQCQVYVTESMKQALSEVENQSEFVRQAIAARMRKFGLCNDDYSRLKSLAAGLGLPLDELVYRVLKSAIKDGDRGQLRLDYVERFRDLLPRGDRELRELSERSGVELQKLRDIRSGKLNDLRHKELSRLQEALGVD